MKCQNKTKHTQNIGKNVWQSRVEIEGYSVAYFDRIIAFEGWTCVKGGAHKHFVVFMRYSYTYEARISPPLTEVQQYSASKAVCIFLYL